MKHMIINSNIHYFLMIAVISSLCSCRDVYAVWLHKKTDVPYAQPMKHPLDQPMMDELGGKGFYINLGPTGIRARIDPETPRQFKVMYVFQDTKSPAKGKIHAGDIIIGANGKEFKTDHLFDRNGKRGWPGPPYDLALAIEDSQGRDGKLSLMVLPGGKKSGKTSVVLQLKPVGRFSPTYPWNCPRSEKLLKELCDFMFEQNDMEAGRIYQRYQEWLALWAADDKRIYPIVKKEARKLMKYRADPYANANVTWEWGYRGIFLGEYYHMTKNKRAVPAAEALNEAYDLGQDLATGGYSHTPFISILKRRAAGGPPGYGQMAAPSGLCMLAQSIFKQEGLPYSESAYNRSHVAYLRTAGAAKHGSIFYRFNGGGIAIVELKNPKKAKSSKGIGFLVETGMKDLGEYSVLLSYPKGKDTGWIRNEAAKNRVIDLGGAKRKIIRADIPPEPTRPFDNGGGQGRMILPVGLGALSHYIGNNGNQSWNYLGAHMATCCANSARTLWDGHARGVMHAFFGVLGAARADQKQFRKFLDYSKTWIILSETHDGGLVEQPFGWQANHTCSLERNRREYTTVAILLLSLPKRNLLITGADIDSPYVEKTVSAAKRTAPAPKPIPKRTARTISTSKIQILNKALLSTLIKLSDENSLMPVPLNISRTRAIVNLIKAQSNGALTFKLEQGTQTAEIMWDDLTDIDFSTLSMLVAKLRPKSSDAQAMAGLYLEHIGRLDLADKYFKNAGDAACKKFEKLFN